MNDQRHPPSQPHPGPAYARPGVQPGPAGAPAGPARVPPAGPTGVVEFTVQGSELTTNLVTPTAFINGHRFVTRYGHQSIVVPAGPVRVEVHTQWMRRYGQATLEFVMQPGQHVPVYYAAPYHQFTTGSIGHTEQKRKGLGGLVLIVGGLLGVFALFIVLVVVSGLAG